MEGESGPKLELTLGRLATAKKILVTLGVITVALGTYGYSLPPTNPDPACLPGFRPDGIAGFLELLYRSLTLFAISETNARIGECFRNWPLLIGRLTGASAFIGAVLGVFWILVARQLSALSLRALANHVVIIGFGAKGHARGAESLAAGERVVAIDIALPEIPRLAEFFSGLRALPGDGAQDSVLRRARVDKALRVTVCTGEDARNLRIARTVEAFARAAGTQPAIEVSIENPLILRALAAGDSDTAVERFSLSDIVAYGLCETARFAEIADLMGAPRVHVVMLGFTGQAPAQVAQILRTGLIGGLAAPMVSVLAPDREGVRDALRLAYPEIFEAAQVSAIPFNPERQALDDGDLMTRIAALSPVTGVVIPGPAGEVAVSIALAAHEAMRRSGAWNAPVFYAAPSREAVPGLVRPVTGQRRMSDVLQPFAASTSECARRHIARRDALARALHQAYRASFATLSAKGTPPSSATRTLVDWEALPNTYRQANRRAADQLVPKLITAGYFVPPGDLRLGPGVSLAAPPETLEILARLEHQSWMLDRRLDGWRPGRVRDDSRRVHDCLVPYDSLPEATRELDRAQIRALDANLAALVANGEKSQPLIRQDLWIGLIGDAELNAAEMSLLSATLRETLIPEIADRHPNHQITLVPALAPGAGMTMTRAALEALGARARQCRLLVPEALAWSDVLAEHGGGAADTLAREAIFDMCPSTRFVELDRLAPGAGARERTAGQRLQNAYIVQRAHILIAALRLAPERRSGSTAEALAWRRDPAATPDELKRFAGRPNAPASDQPHLLVIDLARLGAQP